MIHILNAPRAICSCCPEDIAKLFQACEGPIGGYLFLTLLLNVPAALCALVAINDAQVIKCTVADLAMLCKVDLFIALANILFATYLKVTIEGGEMASGLEAQLHAGPQRQPRFRRIRTGVRNLVLYDVKTCVYIFVFCFSIIWNIMGSTWIQPCMLNSVAPSSMISLEVVFAVLSIFYVGCSVVFVNCADCYEGVQSSRSISDIFDLIRSVRPLAAIVEAICSRAQKPPANSERGPPEAPQVLMGVPVAHVVQPAPSAPPASFVAALASSRAPPAQAAQALDTRQAMSSAA